MEVWVVVHICNKRRAVDVFTNYTIAKERFHSILDYYSNIDNVGYRHLDDLEKARPGVLLVMCQKEVNMDSAY